MMTVDLRPTIELDSQTFVSAPVSLSDGTDVGLQARTTAICPFFLEGSSDGEEWFPLDLETMAGLVIPQVTVAGIYRLRAPIVTSIRIACGSAADPSTPFAIVTLP